MITEWPGQNSAFSRQFLIMATQVRSQVISCGIYGGQSGIEAGFLQVLRL
jgi:hypothetical protein